jgi:hypothetical protein
MALSFYGILVVTWTILRATPALSGSHAHWSHVHSCRSQLLRGGASIQYYYYVLVYVQLHNL